MAELEGTSLTPEPDEAYGKNNKLDEALNGERRSIRTSVVVPATSSDEQIIALDVGVHLERPRQPASIRSAGQGPRIRSEVVSLPALGPR